MDAKTKLAEAEETIGNLQAEFDDAYARAEEAENEAADFHNQRDELAELGGTLAQHLRRAWAELVKVHWGEGTAEGVQFLADIEVAIAEWEEVT